MDHFGEGSGMNDKSRLNLLLIQVLVASLMLTLIGRLFYLQVAASGKYQSAALSIQSRDVITQPVRGAIIDSQGVPLVLDRPGLVIAVDRSTLDKQSDQGRAVLKKVAGLLGQNLSDIWVATRLCGELPLGKRTGCWKGTRFQPIPITRTATQVQALKILENADKYPGITAEPVPIRTYPSLEGENAAHLLGYVGSPTESDLANTSQHYFPDEVIGKSGLEYEYNSYLRGTPGVKTLLVDRKESVTQQSRNIQAEPGDNLILNINAKLQGAAEKALERSVMSARAQGYHGDSGGAVVLNVKTGQVLALASYPTYDPNIWQKGLTVSQANALFSASDGVPALSRPLTGMYPPASTFKSISVVAATKAGYSMNASYDCPADVKVGNRIFKNFETKPMGRIPMLTAIAVSCDTVWYKIAYDEWLKDGGLSPHSNPNDYFFKTAAGFGFGKTTGIDLPGEASGRLPDRQWKEAFYQSNKDFYCNFQQRAKKADLTPYLIALEKENCIDGDKVRAGDAVNFAIGQGDALITPIQMAVIYSAIANGGTLYKPEVARAIVAPDGKVLKEFTPEVIGHTPTTSADIDFLHRALRAVATSGTAAPDFAGYPVHVAGKTGTGQVFGKNPNGSAMDDTSWFASFAPVEDPQFAVVMVVSQGGFGASTAAVGVKDIYSALYGVSGGSVDPKNSVYPHGLPSALPKVDPTRMKLSK